jgi:ribonuclease HI
MMKSPWVSPETGFTLRSTMHRTSSMRDLYTFVFLVWCVFFSCVHEFFLSHSYCVLCLHAHMTSSFPIFIGFADGASRHTQNIASTAWVIYHSNELVSSGGIFLGSSTNNMAEYHVVVKILTEASSLGISCKIVKLDSQLVVCQLNQIYAIHSTILLRLHLRVHCLERMFDFIEYRHIPRELNTTSDSLANYIMDRCLSHR